MFHDINADQLFSRRRTPFLGFAENWNKAKCSKTQDAFVLLLFNHRHRTVSQIRLLINPLDSKCSTSILQHYFRLLFVRQNAVLSTGSVGQRRSSSSSITKWGGSRISRKRFVRRSPYFTRLSGKICPTNLPDMTSLAASGRLQNAIKYCAKVRKTGPGGLRVD